MLSMLTVIVPVVVVILAWLLNEWSKRKYEEYRRKENRYSQLIRTSRGFYKGSRSKELADKFITEVNLAWLYCPDRIIRLAYEFLDTVSDRGGNYTDQQREQVYGKLIAEIRRDLLGRKTVRTTELEASDFRHLMGTPAEGNLSP